MLNFPLGATNMPALQVDPTESNRATEKLSPIVMIACGWPILLVAVGGLVGGLLGGIAFATNMGLYRSKLPRWSLWLLNPAVGLTAIVLWFLIAILIELALAG